MGSRCVCDKLLRNDFVQFRIRQVSAGARWTWQELAKAMAVSQTPGLLRFGSKLGLPALVSALVFISETEAETHVADLLDVGLLEEPEPGALALPALIAPSPKRSEAARRNGFLGGRPRKDGSPPRQREMLLPVAGGGVPEPSETQRKPSAAQSVSPPSTTATSKQVAAETERLSDGLVQRVAEAAGWDPSRRIAGAELVAQWLQLGATEALILEVIGRRARPGIVTLRYFDQAVREEVGRLPPAYDPAEEPFRQQWREAIAEWRVTGRGPAPALADYLARARSAA